MEALLESGNQFVAFSQYRTIGVEGCLSERINFSHIGPIAESIYELGIYLADA
jgi:hypothetical protein